MELKTKSHLQFDQKSNPLEVRLTERPFKAYLVANLAFLDGVEISAEHYNLSLGAVYAAMSFYEDNRLAIEQAIQDSRAIDFGDMEINGTEAITIIKNRLQNMRKDNN